MNGTSIGFWFMVLFLECVTVCMFYSLLATAIRCHMFCYCLDRLTRYVSKLNVTIRAIKITLVNILFWFCVIGSYKRQNIVSHLNEIERFLCHAQTVSNLFMNAMLMKANSI